MSWTKLNDTRRFNDTPADGFEYNEDITISTDKVIEVKPYHFYGCDSRYVKTCELITPSTIDTRPAPATQPTQPTRARSTSCGASTTKRLCTVT